MSANHLSKLQRLFGLLLLLSALFIEGRAQIKFVQITDPHLFDQTEEASDNEQALISCVKEINERVDKGNMYQFVVVTGDIGVEKIVEKLIPQKEAATGKARERVEQQIAKEINKGVGVLSSILSSSKVRLWLFVPGNNDLYKENPASIEYYHQFIERLASTLGPQGIEVRDLCPADNNPPKGLYAKSSAYVYGSYAFIGFNNASFKNNDDSRNLIPSKGGGLSPDELKGIQGKYIEQVRNLLDGTPDGKEFSFVYLFYHIPDVDDPYLISGNEANDDKLKKKLNERKKAVDAKAIDDSTKYSSWFVHRDVRAAWYSLLNDSSGVKLAGLFAGHLHDWKRETYQNYHWLKTGSYPSGSLSKLYICPPISVKLQSDEPDQARGFMEVSIDPQGRILDEWGRSGARIFWYNPATKSFTSDENEKEVEWLNQLALGRIYEASGRLDEAEAAYTKALASKSAVTRRNASESAQRVAEKRVFPLNRYFFTPWGFSLSLEGTALLISTSLLLILSAVGLAGRRRKVTPSTTYLLMFAAVFGALIFILWLAANFLFFNDISISPRTAISLAVVATMLDLWLLLVIMKRQGRNVLVVSPLTDATDHKLGATFPHVLFQKRDDIIGSRKDGFIAPDLAVAVVKFEEETDFTGLIESVVPGGFGKIVSWLVRKANQPQHYLRGSLQASGGNLMMIVILESAGREPKVWSKDFALDQLLSVEMGLAYEVLIYTEAPELWQ